jgi:hypothetical protein
MLQLAIHMVNIKICMVLFTSLVSSLANLLCKKVLKVMTYEIYKV